MKETIEIECREIVKKFAIQMELKLRDNDHKGGWSMCSIDELFTRLLEETAELHRAITFNMEEQNPELEAVDIANFCMMIWEHLTNFKTIKDNLNDS